MERQKHRMFEHADLPVDFGRLSDNGLVNTLKEQESMIKRVVWRLDPRLFEDVYGRVFFAHDDLERDWTVYRDPLEAKAVKLGELAIEESFARIMATPFTQFDSTRSIGAYLLETGRFALVQKKGERSYDAGKSTGAYGEYGTVVEYTLLTLDKADPQHMFVLAAYGRVIANMINSILSSSSGNKGRS